MKIDLAKKVFDYVEQAYTETRERKEQPLPEWINGLKSDRMAAKVAHLCLQASVVSMLNRSTDMPRHIPLQQGMTAAEFADTSAGLRELSKRDNEPDPLVPVFSDLAQYLRYTGGVSNTREFAYQTWDTDPLHALATEACARSAAAVTPIDVVSYMTKLADQPHCDAYAKDGLGLLYGAPSGIVVDMVGDELREKTRIEIPITLKDSFNESIQWFKPAEFANRAFIELEKLLHSKKGSALALLVNAARIDLPFYPTHTSEDEDMGESAGVLNHCLTAGYHRVVVLVSNHYLTAGRGRAQKILTHCLQHGLRQVIQLPMGVIGLRSQAHSILLFEDTPNTAALEFVDLSDDQYTRGATKGFGCPRRARELSFSGLNHLAGPRYSAQVQALQNQGGTKKGLRKIVSFEVGQFSKQDPFMPLRGTYEFMRLQDFMDVFRSHHIEETGEKERAQYFEIGANDISEEGWIKLGKKNDRPLQSLDRRKAQKLQENDLILCFRGSPDSYAKVGVFNLKVDATAVPNQSFVIIRRKADAPSNAPTAHHVFWWLRSIYAQQYLRLKAISPDVMRIAPRDIASLEIPCGPTDLIDLETTKIERALEAVQSIHNLRSQVAMLYRNAWNASGIDGVDSSAKLSQCSR
jgi:hypothetical protein